MQKSRFSFTKNLNFKYNVIMKFFFLVCYLIIMLMIELRRYRKLIDR